MTELADDYDDLVDRYNDLLERAKNALAEAESLRSKLQGAGWCLDRADTLDRAQACLPRY
ncbi:hypothetical protein [Rhodobacteraceae bacterium DSL-40]|uniref:hypothetical protein n=1 Tax=Amaricoccus sp. B4 TaxID=3368557 RepID=UPI0013A68E22